MLKILYIGNFSVKTPGENEIADALEELGHAVLRVEESTATCEDIKRQSEGSDLVLFAKLRVKDLMANGEALLKDLKIPSVCWIFDLYVSL